MITLFCDLDNTILFSYRRKLNVPKRVAETLNGVEQSYITERTFSFLSGNPNISVVPVTTRTFSQYERVKRTIDFFNCSYVLIMNGAVLIKNGVVDKCWLDESTELVKCSTKEMDEVAEVLKIEKSVELKYHDNFFAYGKALDPEKVSNRINLIFDQSMIHSFFDSRKVYCIPPILTKGNAVKRLSKILKPELSFAVGDNKRTAWKPPVYRKGWGLPVCPPSRLHPV